MKTKFLTGPQHSLTSNPPVKVMDWGLLSTLISWDPMQLHKNEDSRLCSLNMILSTITWDLFQMCILRKLKGNRSRTPVVTLLSSLILRAQEIRINW